MKYVISATAILLANVGVFALPQGGRVEAGTGNLDNPAHIIQESQHLQTRWNSFDIAAKEQVRIEQPNAQASINIKVRNGGATTINGTLTANGRVSLENPAGIQFGKNSVVNVGGLLASSAKGAVTSLGQVRATEAIRFQSLSGESVVNVGGNVSAQEIIVEGNGDIIIGNSAHFTANKQVLIGGGFQGKDSSVLNSRTTDVKAAAQINAPYVIVWSDKETSFLGRIDAGRGFVEVSGKQHLIFPDISRAKAGTLLLDPLSVFIDGRRGGFAGDEHIKDDGTVNVDEFSGQNFGLGVDAINNYNGNVVLTALGSITVRADANINKSNGSLTLSANNIVINAAITISGAGHYLSFELTGAVNATPFTFGTAADSVGSIVTDDLRIANNYTDTAQFNPDPSFTARLAVEGRSVTITAPAHGGINLAHGFNLCAAGNTGCGDLTISAGAVSLGGTFVADDINLTVAAGAIAFNSNPTITANSIKLTQVNAFPNAAPATFSVKPGIVRSGGDTQAAVSWATDGNIPVPRNIIVDAGTDINLADEIAGFFDVVGGILDLGSFSLSINISGTLTLPPRLRQIVTAGNNITLMVGTLSTQNANLTIQTTGSGDITLQGSYNVERYTLKLASAGALNFGTGAETSLTGLTLLFTSADPATASGQKLTLSGSLTISLEVDVNVAELVLETSGSLSGTPTLATSALSVIYTGSGSTALPSWVFGSFPTTLTVPSINIGGTTTWAADSITFTGNTNITGAGALTLNVPTINAGSNNLTINLPSLTLGTSTTMTAANISLTASAGGIDFGTTSTITAPTINLSQTADYATSLPATFSTTPILTAPTSFTRPSWGVCGANCLVPANLVITDGNLEGALVGTFAVSGGDLNLGGFSLTSSGDPLVVPAGIMRILSGGTISITGGLTAEGDLSLLTDTMELGGTFTTSTGRLEFGSFDETLNISAVGDLTFNSHVVLRSLAHSLGSSGFDLTLDSVDASSASFVLSGNNITLNGAFTGTQSITITAANDLFVNDTITATNALALTATAGGITFDSTSTAITAASIALTQADAYGASAPATFNNPPTLNSSTSFIPPSWGVCGDNCTVPVPADLVITDGDLEKALIGKFIVPSNGYLELGTFSLTSSGAPLVIPASIVRILTTGTISITGGLTASETITFFTDNMELGGIFMATTGNLRFGERNNAVNIMVVADLTFNSPVVMLTAAHSLGSTGFNLTFNSIETNYASFVLSGENITLNGALTAAGSITITAANDLVVNDSITAGTIALTATAGGITFNGTPTITAPSIALSQMDPYVASAPATFSTPPTLTTPVSFAKLSWGNCGLNCFDPATDIIVTDGNLEAAIVGKATIDNGQLRLDGGGLLSSGVPLVIPAGLTRILFGGSVSITGGLTAEGAVGFFADAIELSGTITTGTGGGSKDFMLGSYNETVNVRAAGDLTFNAHVIMGPDASSLGSSGFNLTLDSVDASSASFVLSGKNITLNGALTATQSITITAANDIVVNDSITLSKALALTATAGGITFNGNPTITAGSIALLQMDPYVVSAPATFSTPPTLAAPTSFTNPPSWGVCGTNCFAAANLTITDGNLDAALTNTFIISGTTLDLGTFNLTASGISLTIPAGITRITTKGTISITGGLTASASLNLTAGTMALGGTFTAGSNTFTLTSANAITAGSALTISSALTMAAPSLGSTGFDLTLASVTGSSALALRGDNITLGSLTLSSGILEVTADDNIAFTSNPTITAAEVHLTWKGDADFGATAPATFTDGTNTITPFVQAANQTAAVWFRLAGFSLDAGSDDISFSEVVTLTRGSERMDVSVSADGVLDFGGNIIYLTTTGNILLPASVREIRAGNLTINATTIGRGAGEVFPFSGALAITTTGDLELNGNLAMDAGVALNLSFGGTLGGTPTLTATNLGITSTGSSAVALPSWVFGDDTRQLRLNVAAITLAVNEKWVAESVTFGKDTTITNTSAFILTVPTVEAGENTLTINVQQLNFFAGAAATITAGTVSLTAVSASGEPSDTPSLTITATTGNLTLDGRFTIGDGAMTLTATQGVIVFTDNPLLRATSFSLTQGGAAFAAAKPAAFRNVSSTADVRPTIRYTGGVQLPVNWAVAITAAPVVETDGGGYNINTLLNTGGALAEFETTPGILDLGENDLILDTESNIAIPGRITQIRARNIIIRAAIFGRGTVAAPAALNADIEFVATDVIVFRADIQSGNKITFTGTSIIFNDKKTTRISASEIVIATTGTGFANNQNVFLEATGNITLAGDVDVGLGSLIINAGGSIVTTDTATLRANKISYNPAVVVRNANALTLTAYDDIYLPGVNLNNGDGALSLTAGGSIVTGSTRSILGTTVSFKQGQARYETGRLLLRAFTGALTIDGHIAHDMITLRVSNPNLLDLTDAILEGVVSAVTQ